MSKPAGVSVSCVVLKLRADFVSNADKGHRYIALNEQLLKLAKSDDEVASLVGHCIADVLVDYRREDEN